MIKGKMKNVIVVNNTGSEVFEQAIFIVRQSEKRYSEKLMRSEALRIIAEKTDLSGRKSKLFGKEHFCAFCHLDKQLIHILRYKKTIICFTWLFDSFCIFSVDNPVDKVDNSRI